MSKNFYILVSYLLLSSVFYIYIAEPALNGSIELRVWADSPTYEALADTFEDTSGLISVTGNYLGPVMVVKLLNNNYFYIYLFNCLIFVVSYYVLSNTININSSKLLFFLVINPMLFLSLMSVNKEILSLLFIALLISYLENKKKRYLLLCFFVSFLIRWQLTLFLLLYLTLTSSLFKMNMNRVKALSIFVLSISAMYIFMPQETQFFEDAASFFADIDTQGSGLFLWLNDIQSQYGYFIVVIPKIVLNLFGGITRIFTMFDWSDFYNNFIVLLQCIYLLTLAMFLMVKRKMDMYNDLFYLAVVYCVIFGITPIVQARYFFIVSVMFAALLSDDRNDKIGRGVELNHD